MKLEKRSRERPEQNRGRAATQARRQPASAVARCLPPRGNFTARVTLLLLLAPFFLIFEIWQLVLSERYLGIKQIARSADPRTLGMSEITAFFWSTAIIGYWGWMLVLLLTSARAPAAMLLLLSSIGFTFRRGAPLKWILVILTFEGAFRIGALIWICALTWRQMGRA